MKYIGEDVEDYVFYEPKPTDQVDDGTLERCLYNASKMEKLDDKKNLYACESCTEAKYGTSKVLPIHNFISRKQEKAV